MLVKCQICGKKDTEKEEMECVTTEQKSGKNAGKKTRKYFHKGACYEKHLNDIEFKEKEYEQLDQLVETIMEIHNIKVIPNSFFPYLQDLRNGTMLLGGRKKKKFKQGYTYDIIEKTYKGCKGTIQHTLKTKKDFKDDLAKLKYCFVIVNKKVDLIKKKDDKKKFAKMQREEKKKNEIVTDLEDREVVFKKKNTSKDDLENFLD